MFTHQFTLLSCMDIFLYSIEFYPLTQRGYGSMSKLICKQHLPCSVSFGACLDVVWRFNQTTFYIGTSRVKLILASQDVSKWVWPSMNQDRLLSIQFKHSPQACSSNRKKLLILYAKNPMENQRTNSWQKYHRANSLVSLQVSEYPELDPHITFAS